MQRNASLEEQHFLARLMRRHNAYRYGLGVPLCLLMTASCSLPPGERGEESAADHAVTPAVVENADERLPDLDFQTLLKCARLSKTVYARPGTAEYDTLREQFQKDYFVLWNEFEYEVNLMKNTRTLKSFLLLRDDTNREQFVCVAGTDGYADWKINIEYPFKTELAGAEIFVHPQFAGLAQELYSNELKDELRDDYRTYVTGHSLGGAIAAIIGMLIQDDGKGDLQHAYTFGQPKFTNLSTDGLNDSSGVFAQRKFPLLRVVNAGDPVPRLPPYSLLKDFAGNTGRYAHLGDELLLSAQGQSDFQPFLDKTGSVIAKNADASDLTEWPSTAFSLKNASAHSINTYIQNIEDILPPDSAE